MLIKKKRALTKAEQEKAPLQLEIESVQAKVQIVESKVVDLKFDIKRPEAEADLVPKPTAIAEALGIPSIPKAVLGMERGKILMDEINTAINSLLELAKDSNNERGMDIDLTGGASAAEEEQSAAPAAAADEEKSGGATSNSPKKTRITIIFKKSAR